MPKEQNLELLDNAEAAAGSFCKRFLAMDHLPSITYFQYLQLPLCSALDSILFPVAQILGVLERPVRLKLNWILR